MTLLAIDVGTTHCKVGLFDDEGHILALAARPTHTQQTPDGYAYAPEQLWQQVATAVREITAAPGSAAIAGIGISSMAETGLLIEADGRSRTPFIPWFDTRTVPQNQALRRETDVQQRFFHTGMRPSYKCAVAKLLWLEAHHPGISSGATWLSVADYVAYRLTGHMATDDSLAGRTYAFQLQERRWDTSWLHEIDLSEVQFPEAYPAGTVIGRVQADVAAALALPARTPVVIAGHDHVCAAFAAGAVRPDTVFDSMGTAEALVGALAEVALDAQHFESGLMYGRHAARGCYYWMGGLSASGGSVEWLRGLLNEPALSYEALDALLRDLPLQPTGILYFPYLAGSGSPHADEQVRGAFVGLRTEHGRAHLVQAVLEGTAYEMEWIRRTAATATGLPNERVVAAGGGTRNRRWLQIKADVCNCPLAILAATEATLLGAALLAGLGSGIYKDEAEALSLPALGQSDQLQPDPARHEAHRRLFETGYCGLQEPLRRTATDLGATAA